MAVSYREPISILQVVVFVPVLLLGLMLNFRHGFTQSSGWFFLITPSLLRLIVAICWLAYASHPSTGVASTAIVCTSIGLSLLTLFNDFTTKCIPIQLFRYPGILSLIGLCLGITGGIIASNSSTSFVTNPWTKAAVIIFMAVSLVVIAILVLLVLRVSQIRVGERRILILVAICCPFIAVRLVYALMSDFANNHLFNSTYGDLTIYLCMAVIEELIVCMICVAVGFTIPVVSNAAPVEIVPFVKNSTDNADNSATMLAAGASPKTRRRGGPITWFFRTVRDYSWQRQS